MLCRSRDMETAGTPGADAFREVRVQSVLVEFLLTNVETLFSDTFTSIGKKKKSSLSIITSPTAYFFPFQHVSSLQLPRL